MCSASPAGAVAYCTCTTTSVPGFQPSTSVLQHLNKPHSKLGAPFVSQHTSTSSRRQQKVSCHKCEVQNAHFPPPALPNCSRLPHPEVIAHPLKVFGAEAGAEQPLWRDPRHPLPYKLQHLGCVQLLAQRGAQLRAGQGGCQAHGRWSKSGRQASSGHSVSRPLATPLRKV